MALSLIKRRKTVYLEFKDYVIRAVEVGRMKPLTISSANELYLPPGVIENGMIIEPKTLELILKRCIVQWKLKRKDVQFIVPDAYVVIRKQFIPANITDEEIRGYIFFELGQSIHLPFDNPTFDYTIVGQDEDRKELILFAAPEDLVQSYADLLEKVKLRPEAADVSSLALYRLYAQRERPSEHEEMLLLKLDVYHAGITIFRNHRPVFTQQQPLVYEQEIEVTDTGIIVHHSDMIGEKAEELVGEIERILHFYNYSLMAGTSNITKVLVIGDNPFLKELYTVIKARLSLDIDLMYYPSISALGEASLHPKYYTPLGLSLKEV